jgi:PAS domain S-box-containing protein
VDSDTLAAALERTGAHDHLCSIYERPEERFAVAVPYLRVGLQRGDKCLYIGNDGEQGVIRREIEAAGIDAERALASGALTLTTRERAYMKHGVFDPQEMFAFWRRCAGEAAREGHGVLRAADETDWLVQGGAGLERWMQYESRLAQVLDECTCLSLCQYNRRLFPAELLLAVIRAHPVVIYAGTVARNPYHVPPEEYVRDNPPERELERLLRDIAEREKAESALRRKQKALQDRQRELQRVEDLLAEDLSAMTRLHDVGTRLTATHDPRALLMDVLDAAIALQVADFGSIQVLDPEKRALEIVAQRGFNPDFLARFPEVGSACSPALLGRERVIIADVQAEPSFAQYCSDAEAAGFRAVYSTPLVSSSGVMLGILSTHFRRPHRPSEREPRFTYLYARQAANIIEHWRADHALRRSEANLAEGQRMSHTGSWAWNGSSGELYWSAEHFRIFGLEPRAAGISLREAVGLIHPEDRQALEESFRAAIREKRDFEYEARVVRPGGEVRNIHSKGRPVCDDAGALVEYVGTIIDTTERRRAEEKLRESTQKLQLILSSITENFFAFDERWRFTYLNSHAAAQMKALSKDPDVVIGKVLWDVFPQVPNEADMRRVMNERVPVTDELYYAPLGEWLENRMYPSPDGGFVIFQSYVTGRKRAEEAVQKAREELAHVNRALTVAELTASIAHELNQPLAAVVAGANACERWLSAPLPNIEEAEQGLHRIARDAKRASEVIARIRALLSRNAAPRTEVCVDELVRDVLTLVQGEAQAKGIVLQCSAPADLAPLIADRVQLQQVLLNLAVNAMEAMAAVAGDRTLEIRAQAAGRDGVLVRVRDSGIGLSAAEAARVFDAFYTTKPEGMGMGLAICRSIVEAHGGRLWMTANEGPGATFAFTIPRP